MALKVAIIGAGPAGCALARLLQQSGQDIAVNIYESEASLDFRSQGGTLDLHVKTGQACLKAANLFPQFEEHARYDGEAMNICDKHLLSYIKQGASKPGSWTSTGRPEIDRPKLRELLYNSLAPGTVKWSHKLTFISPPASSSPNSKPILDFSNAPDAMDFDLIVGADGAFSRVRPYLSDTQPFYSGIAGHAFRIPNAETEHPELYTLANRGSLFSFSDGRSIMAQYMGDGSLNCATWAVRPATWKDEGWDVHDPKAVKERVRQEYADWDPRLVAFTQAAEEGPGGVVPRDLFMLPIGHEWEHRKGVTLIGDAAHVCTPFAGEGVNLALEDAMKISNAIVAAAAETGDEEARREVLDKKVKEFEKDMFVRAKATAQMTWDMMNAMYMVPGAPRDGIEKYIITAVEGEMGWWLTRLLLKPLVYAYFFVFKMIW
ncbi:uncharacterized protein LTR77_005013 [Saxophila tyrrhenica]|uniref:FAD-binding domain-containing protein n=1 Tax=Saxophila tyrrhenica TaxID=1690608 RepID=A0AAV9PBH4_9PEZI|nr:hypothetical protein LTR77_005013 [Saxophila tyrrhenica]